MSKITKKEIKKLSLLSRISVSEKEAKELQKDLENILNFVSKLKKADVSNVKNFGNENRNVFRSDDILKEAGGHTQLLLKQAPEIKNGYIKVKKVL